MIYLTDQFVVEKFSLIVANICNYLIDKKNQNFTKQYKNFTLILLFSPI